MSIFVARRPRLIFRDLHSAGDVCAGLGISLPSLPGFVAQKNKHYRALHLVKKNGGGARLVYQVGASLRRVQLEINESLLKEAVVHDAAHGFVRGRSTVTNARQHRQAEQLLNVDIEDFFGRFRFDMVLDYFLSLGTAEEAARTLTELVTLGESLPQGAVTSPLLSNAISHGVDVALAALAARVGCVYTRYVDDLTFSGAETPTIESVTAVLRGSGFSINKRKTKLRKRSQAQYVTGLSVASPSGPRLPKRMRRMLRMELYYANRFSVDAHVARRGRAAEEWLHWVDGTLAYAFSVEPEWTKALIKEFPDGVPDRWAPRTQ